MTRTPGVAPALLAFALTVAPVAAADPVGAGTPPAAPEGAPPAPAPPAPRNILLITVESLRADRLGCYTGGKSATPAIDSLAARGVRFERAYAASPSTAPSLASILTGLYPRRHGLRSDLGGRIGDEIPTLAGTLAGAGYRTGAVVGSFHVDSDHSLDRGFQTFDDRIEGIRKLVAGRSKERRADEVVRRGLQFLDAGKKGRPFFLWLDLYDPHFDYDPPEALKKRFESDPYAGELAHVDSQIGVLLEGLRSRGLKGTTIIILAGSHGEGLGDHSEAGHGIYLFETTIRVPLIAVTPGARGRTVSVPVSLVDLAPTALDLAGVRAPAALDGRSFASLLGGGKKAAGKPGPPKAAAPAGCSSRRARRFWPTAGARSSP